MREYVYGCRYKKLLVLTMLLILIVAMPLSLLSCGGILSNINSTSSTQDSSATDSTTIVSVTNISGVPATATVGTELILAGTVEPSDAANQVIVWSVADAGKTNAAITNTNALNATAAGTVKVKATITDGIAVGTDFTKEFTITVGAAFVPITDITGVPTTAEDKKDLKFTAIIEPSDATNQTIIWSVTDAGKTGATVRGNTLYTTAIGTVKVKATVVDGIAVGTDFTKEFTIVINVPITNIELKSMETIKIGESKTLIPTINPSHATNKNVIWTSNTPNVATVDNDGVVTALSAGSAIITVTTEDGNFTSDCTVDVPPLAVISVSLNKKTTTLNKGDIETLTASITPVNATNQTLMWTSSDPNIVTVDSSGVMTAVSSGKATVTVTTVDGDKTAACQVTVP